MNDAVYIDGKSLREAAAVVTSNEKLIVPAMKKAVSRVTKWAGNEIRRRVAKEVRITGKVIKGRMVIKASGEWGRVWVGLRPVSLGRLNPRETKTGVTAGPAKRPGAFIVKKLSGNVFEREGPSRLPLKKSPGVEVYAQGARAVTGVTAEIETRLYKEFERELKWKNRQ